MGKNFAIGIDVGIDGAAALLSEQAGLTIYDVPSVQTKATRRDYDVRAMAEIFLAWKIYFRDNDAKGIAAIEKATAMPKQGVVSMFSFGKGFGIWLGLLSMAGIPYEIVPPRKWKAAFELLGKDKDASRAVASRLYPHADLSLKKYHNRADAILLATYAMRYL